MILSLPVAVAQPVNSTVRGIKTGNFTAVWASGADAEALTSLQWMANPNWTNSSYVNTCGNASNDVEYFGNSEAPPDPESGGLVLVGGGTVAPAGTLLWEVSFVPAGFRVVTINSRSANCPPSSAGIDVQTTYRFPNPQDPQTNRFEVERVFDFTAAPFVHDFRPYIPRLSISAGFTEVLYPAPNRTLIVGTTTNCVSGCTGPQSAPGAAPLNPPWDSTQGWFAIHNPTTLEGVVVSRVPSTVPQGSPITAQLWIDADSGSYTDSSSFLLLSPTAGFSGGLITEAETFCFYDSSTWTPSLVPPVGCRNGRLNDVVLTPWTLTFGGQPVGGSSLSQTSTLTNTGRGTLTISKIEADGDFSQTNDCPAKLNATSSCTITVTFTPSASGIRSGSVSIVDVAHSNPQTLNLAGLGLATPAN